MTDAGLAHLQGMRELELLWLSGPGLTDAGLKALGNLSKLQNLGLGGVRVTDDGLWSLRGLKELTHLNLDGTLVTDGGLESLKPLTQLEDLRLNGTGVSNAGLVDLQGLTRLRAVHLKNTNVSAAGAEDFKKATPACQIFTEPARMTDLEKWQGNWVEAACELNGENVVFSDQRPRSSRTIEGNRSFVSDENGVIDALVFRLIPGQTPKAIDVRVTRGQDAGQRTVGIYQIDGDNLKICWAIAGNNARLNSRPSRARGPAARPGGNVRPDRR